MSTATDNAHKLFLRASLAGGEDNFGYPDSVTFLSQEIEGWEDILVQSVFDEGKAVVLVNDEASELLFDPAPRRWLLGLWDQRQGRQRIRVCFRHGAHAYGLTHVTLQRSDIGRLDVKPHPQLA